MPKSPTFCPAPFNSVTVTATGRWALCGGSLADYSFAGGYKNITDSKSIEDWFGSDYMCSVRQAMLNGQPLKECASCYKNESAGITSYRQNQLADFPKVDTNNIKIEYVDIKFGNKCNLSCKMCFPHSSSELMKEWWQLGWSVKDPMEGTRGDYYNNYMLENYNWPADQTNLDKLFEVIKTVKVLKFTGGEPMINPAMFKFLQHCVDSGYAESIVLFVTTNCTKIHPRFLDIAKKFKQLNLRLSIDGTDSVYNYIRYPGNWSETFKNLQTYASWYKNKHINGNIIINFVLSVFNLSNAEHFFRTVRPWIDIFTVADLHKPSFMSWNHAPPSVQKEALKSAVRLSYDSDPVLQHCGRLLTACYTKPLLPATTDSHQKLKNFVQSQDGLRGIRIKSYIPELQSICRPNLQTEKKI
jgi:hypothetical protein